MSKLLSVGGGLLFLGALGFVAIGDAFFGSSLNIPAVGHEPGDAAAWALVAIVLIPLGSVVLLIRTLYRRSRKPPPAYAEFLEEANGEEVDAAGEARYR
ncbi:hypothetical protein [Methylacidimicrobium tartarophylax]|uniref:Uncharacterized protein n=1 Tax=Methylacidimicrobium tartarophylax TaxID=1041768 RepID=A0A5E6MBH8_9BACT|nr:hypothetical protein [Methylacidimicrobium tartarophylax]VVM06320.1 hypothetical protein MAMT_01129 [Methylacidimicrobium tartarophylax]